ncbi:MAG: GNAT family N-acetyltransferase [Asgard group archaeon]|nr:GNAT family N-acetyltransferase [Asgard group archaeon]
MLKKFPQFRLPELISSFADYPYLRIMIKTILKTKTCKAYVDKLRTPELFLLDYKVLAFIGGDHTHPFVQELLKMIPENKMLIFPNENWGKLIQEELVLTAFPRTSFSSEKLTLDRLNELLTSKLPDGYTLEKINVKTLASFNAKLSPAIMPFYKTTREFVRKGLGYCIKEGDFAISFAASSMPIFDDEFMIQVVTDPNTRYRRKGFATRVCATLMKESLEKGIIPFWDADNEIMVRLGLKLGFVKPQNYFSYICSRNPLKS